MPEMDGFQLLEKIDYKSFKLPPLLLQPFVENAIWHGLKIKISTFLIILLLFLPLQLFNVPLHPICLNSLSKLSLNFIVKIEK